MADWVLLPGEAHLVRLADEQHHLVLHHHPHLVVLPVPEDQAPQEPLFGVAGRGEAQEVSAHVGQLGGPSQQQLVYFLQG